MWQIRWRYPRGNEAGVKLHIKGDKKNEKKSHRLGANIYKRPTDKGLLFKIYKELLKFKIKNLITKMNKRTERIAHQRYTDGK